VTTYRGIWSSDAVRRVVRTFLQAFLGLLLPGLLGWLNALTDWANDGGQAPFPDARSLAYVGIAAVAAGFIAVVTAVMTGIEDLTGKGFLRNVPPAPPSPPRNERGSAYVTWSGLALAVLVVVLLVLLL
jgi:uncharacterized membrane protein YdfJ with MMPL/SSD domain